MQQLTTAYLSIVFLCSANANEPRIKAFCVDFNWGDHGFAAPGLFANASPADHVAWYKSLGANTIQTFCVSCPGYAWYRSDIAPVQPGMTGDFLTAVTRLGHAENMRVMGYFCIGANAYWSKTHPDTVHPFADAIAIPFTREYLAYLSAIIPEALTKTGIDGFMIDWVYNASHFYPDKKYTWLPCEKQMYQELFNQPFPGDAAMDTERTNEFNRRALARCWDTIHNAAKSAKPDCIIWLTCFDLQHPQLKESKMLREVDWLMNEHTDPQKLVAAQPFAGPRTTLIQCVCGWGDHDARKIFDNPQFANWGLYGYAKPDSATTLPANDHSTNAKNIEAMRDFFNRK